MKKNKWMIMASVGLLSISPFQKTNAKTLAKKETRVGAKVTDFIKSAYQEMNDNQSLEVVTTDIRKEFTSEKEKNEYIEKLKEEQELVKDMAEEKGGIYQYQITESEKVTDQEEVVVDISKEQDLDKAIKEIENNWNSDEFLLDEIRTEEKFLEEEKVINEVYGSFDEADKRRQEIEKMLGNARIDAIRNFDKDTREEILDTNVYQSLEDAEKAKNEITTDNEFYQVNVEIANRDVFDYTDTKEIQMTFDSKKEMDDYLESLKENGYSLDVQIQENTSSHEISLQVIYDNLEEADSALQVFRENYNGYGIISAIRDSDEDIITFKEGNDAYIFYDEALKVKEELEEDNDDYQVKTSIREKLEKFDFNEIFSSRKEAYNYLDELKREEYVIENYKIIELDDDRERRCDEDDDLYRLIGKASLKSYYVDQEKIVKGYDYEVNAKGEESLANGTYDVSGTYSKDISKTIFELSIEKVNKGYDYLLTGSILEKVNDGYRAFLQTKKRNFNVKVIGNGYYYLSKGEVEVAPPHTEIEEEVINKNSNIDKMAILGLGGSMILFASRKKKYNEEKSIN